MKNYFPVIKVNMGEGVSLLSFFFFFKLIWTNGVLLQMRGYCVSKTILAIKLKGHKSVAIEAFLILLRMQFRWKNCFFFFIFLFVCVCYRWIWEHCLGLVPSAGIPQQRPPHSRAVGSGRETLLGCHYYGDTAGLNKICFKRQQERQKVSGSTAAQAGRHQKS